jgi:hypothetical protein
MTVGWVAGRLNDPKELRRLQDKGRGIPDETAKIVLGHLTAAIQDQRIPENRGLRVHIMGVAGTVSEHKAALRQHRLQTLGLGAVAAAMLGVVASQGASVGMPTAVLAEGGPALALVTGMWLTERLRGQAQQKLCSAQGLLERLKVVEFALSKKNERKQLIADEVGSIRQGGAQTQEFNILHLILSHVFQS